MPTSGAAVIRFTVEDTGSGVPAHSERLFGEFEQGDLSHGASGLGLAITKHLLDLMGGQVTLAKQPAGGTVATVDIRFWMAPSPALEAGSPSARQPAMPGAALRLLVVDDSPLYQREIQNALAASAATVDCAATVAAALRLFSVNQYDLVLLDLNLGEANGLALAQDIRAREAARHRPRTHLVLFRDENAADAGRASDLFDGVLLKPLRCEDLAALFGRLVETGPRLASDIEAMFLNEAESLIWDIQGRLAANDTVGAIQVAHRLAGDAAAAGLAKIALLARELHDSIRNGSPTSGTIETCWPRYKSCVSQQAKRPAVFA